MDYLKEKNGGLLVNCQTLRARQETLKVDGWEFKEGRLSISTYTKRMTLAETFRYVADYLKILEREEEFLPRTVREVYTWDMGYPPRLPGAPEPNFTYEEIDIVEGGG